MVEIIKKKTGNCKCINCGKVQDGYKYHPYTVWHRSEDEKRGHNEPVCSIECAKEYAKSIERRWFDA